MRIQVAQNGGFVDLKFSALSHHLGMKIQFQPI